MLRSAKNKYKDNIQKVLRRTLMKKEGNPLRKQNHLLLHQHPYLSVQRKLQSIQESLDIAFISMKNNIDFVANHFEKMRIFDHNSQELKMIDEIIDLGIQMSLIKERNSNSNQYQRNDQSIDHSQISDYQNQKSEISETSTTCGHLKKKQPERDSQQLNQEESQQSMHSTPKNSKKQNQCQKGTPKFQPNSWVQNNDKNDDQGLSQYWQYLPAHPKTMTMPDFYTKVCSGLEISRQNNIFTINSYNDREITCEEEDYNLDIDEDEILIDDFVHDMHKPLYELNILNGLKPQQRQQLFIHLIEKQNQRYNLDRKDKPISKWAEANNMGHDFNKGMLHSDIFKKVHLRRLHFGIMNGRDILVQLGNVDKMRVQAEIQQQQKQNNRRQTFPEKEKENDETKRITFFKKSSRNKKEFSY